MGSTVVEDKTPDNLRKSSSSSAQPGYMGQAFVGIKSILDIQKSVLERSDSYKKYGDWNLACFTCEDEEAGKPAVEVRHGYKSYKAAGGRQKPILYDMNMTVKKGTIYSLLGSSGCGKTTLLSCIVGLKNLDAGEIFISGRKHGRSKFPVPGRGVGFMPQDISLYGDFSIAETISYFGKLNGMKDGELEKSKDFLVDLLSLPDQARRVKTLSGGQQRRVSIAVTLVHAPPLIILDEPTVGVDPLLREAIWTHLTGLVKMKKTTVIVTTHYIEEASHSDTVGVMRGGRLLTEKSPAELFLEHGTNSLQDVVLKLCHDDEKVGDHLGVQRSKSSGNIMTIQIVSPGCETSSSETSSLPSSTLAIVGKPHANNDACEEKKQTKECFCIGADDMTSSFTRIKSLCWKNYAVMMRNLLLLVFVVALPAVQIVLMGMSMGNDPRPMRIGVVTDEPCDFGQVSQGPRVPEDPNEWNCIIANLSCRYLSHLPHDIVELSEYGSVEEAKDAVVSGSLTGFMRFPANYSDYMFLRDVGGTKVEDETINGTTISLEMDASNTVITGSLKKILFETYQTFIKGLLKDCDKNPELGGLPIRFENPVYGSFDLKLQQFVAAGMIVGVALFFPLASSSITYMWDKKQGTMERARVAGTRQWEILASYFITEGIILIFQTSLCLLVFVTVFNLQILGSAPLAFVLVILNGLAGISLGLLLASICRDEIECILLALAMMMPNFFLAGALWPTEALPLVLQKLSYCLPGTLSNEAFRSIVIRGWGFSHTAVWSGFLSTSLWITFYWTVNILVQKYTSKKQ